VTFLADTNILGELTRPRPNRGVLVWASQVPGLNLSVVTLEEIHYGLSWRPNDRIRSWFEKFLTELRIPEHRDHRFRAIVITHSGILITDSGHRDHSFRDPDHRFRRS
jgi:predicted nucleic acid-binding protein